MSEDLKGKTVVESVTLLGLLYKSLSIIKFIIDKIGIYLRSKNIRKRYRDGKKAVKDGNINDINDILR